MLYQLEICVQHCPTCICSKFLRRSGQWAVFTESLVYDIWWSFFRKKWLWLGMIGGYSHLHAGHPYRAIPGLGRRSTIKYWYHKLWCLLINNHRDSRSRLGIFKDQRCGFWVPMITEHAEKIEKSMDMFLVDQLYKFESCWIMFNLYFGCLKDVKKTAEPAITGGCTATKRSGGGAVARSCSWSWDFVLERAIGEGL